MSTDTNTLAHIKSCGILLYREGPRKKRNRRQLEVFLIKPSGPFFWNSHMCNLWGIPKGRMEESETAIETAHREFGEEVGTPPPENLDYVQLPAFVTHQGKTITIFSADASGKDVQWQGSNTETREYPAGSGRTLTYAETVAGGWFPMEEALKMVGSGQKVILESLRKLLRERRNTPAPV